MFYFTACLDNLCDFGLGNLPTRLFIFLVKLTAVKQLLDRFSHLSALNRSGCGKEHNTFSTNFCLTIVPYEALKSFAS